MAFWLIIKLVFGIITAVIASNKGRNAVGWFIFGFFFDLIALIVVCVISNLKEERARYQRASSERRRLREELRMERMRSRRAHESTSRRLDVHDRALGMDTRKAAEPPPLAGGTAAALEAPQPEGAAAPAWYFADGSGEQVGPITLAQLSEVYGSGRLDSDGLVWKSGWKEWHRLAEVQGLEDKLRGQ